MNSNAPMMPKQMEDCEKAFREFQGDLNSHYKEVHRRMAMDDARIRAERDYQQAKGYVPARSQMKILMPTGGSPQAPGTATPAKPQAAQQEEVEQAYYCPRHGKVMGYPVRLQGNINEPFNDFCAVCVIEHFDKSIHRAEKAPPKPNAVKKW